MVGPPFAGFPTSRTLHASSRSVRSVQCVHASGEPILALLDRCCWRTCVISAVSAISAISAISFTVSAVGAVDRSRLFQVCHLCRPFSTPCPFMKGTSRGLCGHGLVNMFSTLRQYVLAGLVTLDKTIFKFYFPPWRCKVGYEKHARNHLPDVRSFAPTPTLGAESRFSAVSQFNAESLVATRRGNCSPSPGFNHSMIHAMICSSVLDSHSFTSRWKRISWRLKLWPFAAFMDGIADLCPSRFRGVSRFCALTR